MIGKVLGWLGKQGAKAAWRATDLTSASGRILSGAGLVAGANIAEEYAENNFSEAGQQVVGVLGTVAAFKGYHNIARSIVPIGRHVQKEGGRRLTNQYRRAKREFEHQRSYAEGVRGISRQHTILGGPKVQIPKSDLEKYRKRSVKAQKTMYAVRRTAASARKMGVFHKEGKLEGVFANTTPSMLLGWGLRGMGSVGGMMNPAHALSGTVEYGRLLRGSSGRTLAGNIEKFNRMKHPFAPWMALGAAGGAAGGAVRAVAKDRLDTDVSGRAPTNMENFGAGIQFAPSPVRSPGVMRGQYAVTTKMLKRRQV